MLGVMPRVLLVAGLVTTAIGLVLMASGLPIRDGTFDAEILTPGMIAAVGGLLLVGLSLAVRELRRIEQALALRPMPRVTRSAETMTAAADAPDAAVRLPISSKPKTEPRLASLAATEATPTDAAAADDQLSAGTREGEVSAPYPTRRPSTRRAAGGAVVAAGRRSAGRRRCGSDKRRDREPHRKRCLRVLPRDTAAQGTPVSRKSKWFEPQSLLARRAIAGWPGDGGGSCRDRAAGCLCTTVS